VRSGSASVSFFGSTTSTIRGSICGGSHGELSSHVKWFSFPSEMLFADDMLEN